MLKKIIVACVCLLQVPAAWATNGHVMHGVGAINQSMGGAGIAACADTIGGLHNNVACSAFIPANTMSFGFEAFVPRRRMSADSTAVGGIRGSVDSRTREVPIPVMGLVIKSEGAGTFGFSALGIGGFGVDYPANAYAAGANPLAAPQANGGYGAIASNYQLMQMTPSFSYLLTPELSLGGGVNVDWASLAVDPWPATTPNASGYPTGTHPATAWGFGVTGGAVYKPVPEVSLGASLKSPQWFNSFEWNSQYINGAPTTFKFRLDFPMILGVGASWKPVSPLMLAADLRWINYSKTAGFRKKNFSQQTAVQGFGWRDIMVLALGAQYEATQKLKLRAGYNYGENPIPADQQFFNVFAPAVVKHHLTAGAGYRFRPDFGADLGYYHAFRESATGPMINSAAGALNSPIAGTSVTNTLEENSVSMQFSYNF